MSRILSCRLAPGMGAGHLHWSEESRNAIWEIVYKESTVEKTARADGLSDLVIFFVQFGISATNVLSLAPADCECRHQCGTSERLP
jgi:hypothetical protein